MVNALTESFLAHAAELRPRIDAALAARCEFSADCPERLREAIRYSLLAPGKRLRPMLVLLAAEACGGSVEAAMPAACAVEMIHAYSLVHDDLPAMDDDDLRRGRPTCHKAFDEATAILAGDSLLALAFEVLAREILPGDTAARCCAALARAAGPCNLVGGQADDMAGDLGHDGDTDAAMERLRAIHRRKTGALIDVSLRLGALTADASAEQLDALASYGHNVGLAFQVTDDLLDVRSDEQTMGKRVNKDAEQGKLTFPGLLGVEQSLRHAEDLVREAAVALEPLGCRAGHLEALASYVLERNR